MTKPTIRVVPDDGVYSDAQLAVDIASDYYLTADEWQLDVLHDILSEREDGKYVNPVFGYSAPRRNGKSVIIVILALYMLTVQEKEIVYTSHRSQSSLEIWKIMRGLFEDTELSQYVKPNGISSIRGQESIYLTSGASFRLFTRATGGGAGRGSATDVLIFDESYDLPSDTLADLLPMNANSDNPLTLYLGSPSYENADGAVFRKLRESIITGQNPRAGWLEYSAPEGADPFSPEIWAMTNPAMAAGRITEEKMHGYIYSGMARKQILVELLGSWAAESRPLVVDMDHWSAMADPSSNIALESEMILSIDAATDRSKAGIVAVGLRSDGKKHVEVIEHLAGVTWVPEKVIAICAANPNIKSVLIDSKGPLANYAEELIKAKVPVVVTNYDFMASACVSFIDNTGAHAFRHLGDGRLARSITDAALRPLSGRYAFTKADASSDISLLVAMALALYGLNSDKAVSNTKREATGGVYVGGKYYTR